jgi:hypothetical protein
MLEPFPRLVRSDNPQRKDTSSINEELFFRTVIYTQPTFLIDKGHLPKAFKNKEPGFRWVERGSYTRCPLVSRSAACSFQGSDASWLLLLPLKVPICSEGSCLFF